MKNWMVFALTVVGFGILAYIYHSPSPSDERFNGISARVREIYAQYQFAKANSQNYHENLKELEGEKLVRDIETDDFGQNYIGLFPSIATGFLRSIMGNQTDIDCLRQLKKLGVPVYVDLNPLSDIMVLDTGVILPSVDDDPRVPEKLEKFCFETTEQKK